MTRFYLLLLALTSCLFLLLIKHKNSSETAVLFLTSSFLGFRSVKDKTPPPRKKAQLFLDFFFFDGSQGIAWFFFLPISQQCTS